MIKKIQQILSVLILVALIFGVGYYLGLEEADMRTAPDEIDFSLFWEAYNNLERHYVDPEKITEERIVHGAIRGMLESLDDPYTGFFDSEESREFLESVSGYYEGIGLEVGLRDGDIKVISPIEGTPASRAGIKAGDVILEIDGRSTTDMSLERAVDLMRGKQGTEVTLLIGRNRTTHEVDLVRDTIQIPSVDWELLEEDIAYLKIHYFHNDLLTEFNQIVPEITSSPADKMIIDLRNNPGGSLESALEIADYFLSRGDVIVESRGVSGNSLESYEARGSSITFDYDLVILLNQGSASASEILAGALTYHRDALVVGEKSFGKGSIQRLINLSDMSNLKVTVSNWVTPDGNLITDKGIDPDYPVEITAEDIEADYDPQLEKAIEVIKR